MPRLRAETVTPINTPFADATRAFKAVLSEYGLTPPARFTPGEIQRVPSNGDPKDLAGWCMMFHDRRGGVYGDWRDSGDTKRWTLDGPALTKEEKAEHDEQAAAAKVEREAELAEKRAEAKTKAAAIVAAAKPALGTHPYLKRKGLKPVETLYQLPQGKLTRLIGYPPKAGEKPLRGEILIAPVFIDDELSTVEMIDGTGLKTALGGGAKKAGGWWTTPAPDGSGDGLTIAIGEGCATVMTVAEAMGWIGVAALSCGNLGAVALALRKRMPKARLVIIGDIGNGADAAGVAADDADCPVVFPEFGDDRRDGDTDFNDLATLRGIEEVTRQLAAVTFRPIIRLKAGDEPRVVDESEAALIAADRGMYQRGGHVVRVGVVPVKVEDVRSEVLRIIPVGKHNLVEELTKVANFKKPGPKKNWISIGCPTLIADMYLDRTGQWKLPVLTALINCPTLREDGSILDKPGYDATTGLLYDPRGASFSAIPDKPTRAQAVGALDVLKSLIHTFPFVEPADRSVALSGILTAMIRRSLPSAPLHGFTAPVAGSGKSMLVNIAALIATGQPVSVSATGKTDEEMEKRINAALIEGDLILSLDNCEVPLGGDTLCQALSEPSMKVRILGKSENAHIPSQAAIFATGNNLIFIGDVTRRALLCSLDPKVERPETLKFDRDPLKMIRENRDRYVTAALTVLRAFHVADRPKQRDPLGSFDDWSRWVRDALVWLGEADPCDTMEKIREADPQLDALRNIVTLWAETIGNNRVSVKRVIDLASERESSMAVYLRPDFREALFHVAALGSEINSRRLGKWLASSHKRRIDGKRFVRDGNRDGVAIWRLEGAEAIPEPKLLSEVPSKPLKGQRLR